MDKKIDISILKREKRNRLLIIVGVIVAIALGLILIIKSVAPTVTESTLIFSTVDSGALPVTIPASGRVMPAYEENIISPVESRIIKVYAKPGDSIRAGTPLIELDLTSTQTSYSKLLDQYQILCQELSQLRLANHSLLSELAMQTDVKQMQLNGLKLDLENERKLDSIGSGTGERVRQAETSLAAATLELSQLRERLINERSRCNATEQVKQLEISSFKKDLDMMLHTLDQGRIPAPLSGIVTFINHEIGSRIGAGERLAVVSDLSRFRIDGEVAEGSSGKVKHGARVRIRIGNHELSGIVSNISPKSHGGMINFTIDIDTPDDATLRSGIRAELYIDFGFKERSIRISNGTFFIGPGEYELFVADNDGKLQRRTVRLGDSNREHIEVISGLKPGDRVVISDMERYKSKSILRLR